MQHHHSIFEPLFSFKSAAHNMQPSPCIDIPRAGSCPSPPLLLTTHDHAPLLPSKLSLMHHSNLSSPTITHVQELLPSPYTNAAAGSGVDDDGSVASKLLSSIAKSISTSSMQLTCSKLPARQTPYQKALKLKHMKLQHCAEALGMESSDSSSMPVCDNDIPCRRALDETMGMIGEMLYPSSNPPRTSNQELIYSLPLVKSAPNLSSPSMQMMNNSHQHSKFTRCNSFPPPLSHTLPASPSCDSLTLSLRAYREDGRFILKEVMVPSKNYFRANRSDGRLTLHVLTREDEDGENIEKQEAPSTESYALEDGKLELEEDIAPKESKMSLAQTCQSEVGRCENIEILNTNRNHPLVLDVNRSVDSDELLMGDNFNELPIAAMESAPIAHACQGGHYDTGIAETRNLSNLKRIQCPFNVALYGLRHLTDPATRNAKSNIISNMIALTLVQASKNHSKLDTLQKAKVLNSLQSSSCPCSMEHPILIHSPGKRHMRVPSSHHDKSIFQESKENFIWESNLMPCVAVNHQSTGIRRFDDSTSVVLRDLNANCLMELVTALATVGAASYDIRDLCTFTNRRKPSSTEDNTILTTTDALQRDLDSSILVEAYTALNNIIMGGEIGGGQDESIVNCDGGLDAHNLGFNSHDSMGIEAGKGVSLASPLYYSNSALPSPPPPPPPPIATYCKVMSGCTPFTALRSSMIGTNLAFAAS